MDLLVLHQGNPVIVHARWFILAPLDIFKDLGSAYWFHIPGLADLARVSSSAGFNRAARLAIQ